jgi:hypothetical protein
MPIIYYGVLTGATLASGKTELLLRWMRTANRAGYNILLVDAKSDLLPKLGSLRGKLRYFSTIEAPSERGRPSDRINFIGELEALDRKGQRLIRQLAEAIIVPRGSLGEAKVRSNLRKRWLTALINVLKRYELHYSAHAFLGRRPDLGDVYMHASNENRLCRTINEIRQAESVRRRSGKALPDPGIDDWVSELALLLPADKVAGGQKGKENTRQMTMALLEDLQAFGPTGPLHDRIGDIGSGELFSLEELGGAQQVTIVVEAGDEDLTASRTVLTIVTTKIRQLLRERHRETAHRPILLLVAKPHSRFLISCSSLMRS